MKKITTALFASLLLTLFVTNAQAQAKKDSVATEQTPLFSIQDIGRIDSLIQRKFTIAQQQDYNAIRAFIVEIVNGRVALYNNQFKSAAKKP